MKTIDFTSSLSAEMARFVKLKQHSGSDWHSCAKLLLRFDRYLVGLPFRDKILTVAVFQDYFKRIDHLCKRGFYNHYCVLRQFSAWLNQYENDSCVLERRPPAGRVFSRQAYIFSPDEIRAVLENSGSLSKREELVPGLCRTLFSLLYSTGIRIGEACALEHGDWSGEEKLLHIRKGKFRKERYLVAANSMAAQLNKYVKQYKFVLGNSPQAPLFVNMRGNPLKYDSAYRFFVKILAAAGIQKTGNGPRIHDFRHSFAVHRLLQWYETEQNLNAKLPFLSTYMGHADISSTQIYLESANELLRAGHERFERFYSNRVK